MRRRNDADASMFPQQRRRARESVRVSVLQSEAQGREERAGHGDTGGAVSGAVDGGGLFECLESEVGRLDVVRGGA